MVMRHDSRVAIYCHELLHKEYAPNSFPGLIPDSPDPVMTEFMELGLSHEAKVMAAIKKSYPELIEIDQIQNFDAIELQTAKALLNPDSFIIAGAYIGGRVEAELVKAFGVAFAPTQRSSRPDLIVKVGTSSNGHPLWAPVDIKSHIAITDNQSNFLYTSKIPNILPTQESQMQGRLDYHDLHQLAHYTRHLQALGVASDDLWVGIIGSDLAECSWARIGDVVVGQGGNQESFLSIHDEKFAQATEVIRLSEIENDDLSQKAGIGPKNYPGKMGCPGCKYKSTCLAELQNFDQGKGHVTLLARVTPRVVDEHFAKVQSIQDLLNHPATSDLMLKSQIRARVWQTKIPELLNPTEPFEIPEVDIEIDIDLENSMEVLRELEIDEPSGEDRLYLYGFGIHDRTIDKNWSSAVIDNYYDYSNTEQGEFELMSKMWNRLQTEIAKAEKSAKSIKIFHYSPLEFIWWKRFADRYAGKPGVPSEGQVEEFNMQYLVDLYELALRYSFPTMSYSIKDLAKLANFEWSVEMAGGANSLFKYRDAINKNIDQATRNEAIAWLDSYNRDDVRATLAVRDYLRKL